MECIRPLPAFCHPVGGRDLHATKFVNGCDRISIRTDLSDNAEWKTLGRAVAQDCLAMLRDCDHIQVGSVYRRTTALVAVEHSTLFAVWNMLTHAELYTDPGPDYFTRLRPGQSQTRAVKQLEALGYMVTLELHSMAG